ncbi:SpoIIE family protein phosphatase [Chromobacterium alkanivorans]|uniref:SpoIIE family protein phosphatase n=1 Tax=Chromobacterium alkanivorans TaxID=1071719 RepID=UPI00196824FE|nr:SpoIIE family protein phosphatase [Chromobacterium alkanivorans]MBN3004347.1 SpoIIE family protein phosphatase [Chromobacterium alkanivorans]
MPQPKILLVDDSATNSLMVRTFVEDLGYRCDLAGNGREAVAMCKEVGYDLILMDIIMPVMNGLQATMELRTLFGEHWVPIIFLTGLSQQQDLIEGLKAGGDDYLTKPVSPDLLTAKIQVFLRIAQMQRQINQDAVRLERYFLNNEREQSYALELIERLNRQQLELPSHVWRHLRPASQFNGDLVCYARAGDREYLMLADCTGHGLTAAISAIPAVECFYDLAQTQAALGDIAAAINDKLHRLLPFGRFVAGILIAIDAAAQCVQVWNGGIPCALMFDPQGRKIKQFRSEHPPLGILAARQFDRSLETSMLKPEHALVVCSDGITEAQADNGQMFGLDGVIKAVETGWPGRIGNTVLQALQRHRQNEAILDDASLLVVHAPSLKNKQGADMGCVSPSRSRWHDA